ncbi:MAG: YkgJ family cysteine cluster protein [Kofleriaceae bacterium]
MSRWGALTAKVDGFFDRVAARHGDDMQCATGCSDCCHVRLTITAVEATAIEREVAGWRETDREALAANVAGAPADRCVALDANGRCMIYRARPIVCRSHGVPIRMRKDSLPVIETCFRNFTHTTPDASCVLDQEMLSALVMAVNQAEGAGVERVELAEVLVEVTRPSRGA